MPEPIVDDDAFDAVVAPLDPGMIVVTTAVGDERAGCLVGFHAQCSLEPRRYSVWLSKANHTVRIALHAEHLAVHYLAEDEQDLAVLFGTVSEDEVDKFERCEWTEGPHGMPLLDGCRHRVVLRRTGIFDEGSDHVCVVGEPVHVDGADDFAPLRLSTVEDLDPGHEPDERPG